MRNEYKAAFPSGDICPAKCQANQSLSAGVSTLRFLFTGSFFFMHVKKKGGTNRIKN